MGLIQDLRPINLLEEKEKFFSDNSYNPQFEYLKVIPDNDLTKWGYPKPRFVEFARSRLDEITIKEDIAQSDYLSEEQISEKIGSIINSLNLKVNDFAVKFSDSQISRCLISSKGMSFRTPIEITKERLEILINHELFSHLLRRINGKKLGVKSQLAEHEIRFTEEGLAALNGYLASSNKIFFSYLLTYLATDMSTKKSFREVYSNLLSLGISSQKAWNFTVLTKRGLTDTSAPGAFTKGITYLEGILQVYNWVQSNSDDLRTIYVGKLSVDELNREEVKNVNLKDLKIPYFLANQDDYRQKIQEIGQINKLDEI